MNSIFLVISFGFKKSRNRAYLVNTELFFWENEEIFCCKITEGETNNFPLGDLMPLAFYWL